MILDNIFQDWKNNERNIKGRLILFSFRIACLANNNKICFYILILYLVFYRIFVEWILGCELPYKTKIGRGLTIFHGYSLVVNDGTIIGENCTLRHCLTIGNKKIEGNNFSKCPVIGDNVDIGSNVCIIGPITIGNNVIIGAGSVVVKDVPSNCIVAGNPARILKYF